MVVGKPELQRRRLREVAGDIIKCKDATTDRARHQNVDLRIVGELRNPRVRQTLSERPPARQVAIHVAVRNGDGTLLAADDAAVWRIVASKRAEEAAH